MDDKEKIYDAYDKLYPQTKLQIKTIIQMAIIAQGNADMRHKKQSEEGDAA
jgi:hypothetical protein